MPRPDLATLPVTLPSVRPARLARALASAFPRHSYPWWSVGAVLLLELSVAHGGTVQVQTSNDDALSQWTVNGQSVTSTSSFGVPDTLPVELEIDGSASSDFYYFFYTNSSETQGNLSINVSQGEVAFDAPIGVSQPGGQLVFDSVGMSESAGGTTGPNLSGWVEGPQLPFEFGVGQFGSVTQGPTAAIQYRSRGADAGGPFAAGANGGNIDIEFLAELLLGGQTSSGGNSSLPWRPAAAGLALRSIGGEGEFQPNCDDYTGFCQNVTGPGGNGGDVTLTTWHGMAIAFSLDSFDSSLGPLAASAGAPAVALLAHSQGGMGATKDFHGTAGPNGAGGTVRVEADQLNVSGSVPYLMGVVAASVGGATAPPSGAKVNVVPSGAGGNVTVELSRTQIGLLGNNSIGVVATSTGDVIVPADSSLDGQNPATFGNVRVGVGPGSSIRVGDPNGTTHAATDTNIGILAISAPGWATQPFTGAEVSSMHSPGTPGNVTVTLDPTASVEAYGSGALGILAQSIAGNGASASGGTRAFVGDQGSPGGTAGAVTLTTLGSSITTQGDGAIGALLQSIAGGGGNGGNATGLFVAVGGNGGNGGQGGNVSFSQGQGSQIITEGDYAQGVLLQSIGGGGGNGGFAKAYSLIVPVAAGIGGQGGIGGNGGNITLGGALDVASDTSNRILTSGQHAHGLVAHTLGAGGGSGGAATSFDASLFTVSVAVGGSGAGAGAGGNIGGPNGSAGTTTGSIDTQGHDAHGVLLQSIGGGGGAGGGSTAAALSTLTPDEVPTINIGVAVGGSGGSGGAGGNIQFLAQDAITTRGAGAHGVLVQTIGGGGGIGADSTAGAGAFLDSASFDFNSAVGVGGSGGSGAGAGQITLTGANRIATQGHHAVGLTAQSIGGGGGVAGIGNAAAVIGAALEEASMQLDFGVGGSGGTGGQGGQVNLELQSTGSIATSGAGAIGVLAQSIGGGGGVAGNAGAQALGGQFSQVMTVGGTGGTGNDGGAVNVTFAGNISTGNKYQIRYNDASGTSALTTAVATGGNAHGIVAQSIGGGGGIGGNADPSATIVPDLAGAIIDDVNKLFDVKGSLLWWAKKIVDYDTEEYELPKSFKSRVAVGGSGGAGGDGSSVGVTITPGSRIATTGHRSYAVLAQSIGGGGGAGGSASGDSLLDTDIGLSPLTGFDFDLGMNIGGTDGAAGDGDAVTVTVNNAHNSNLDNRLVSTGFGSHLMLLQSIGAGGGIGHEGSMFGLSGKLSGFAIPDITLGQSTSGGSASGNAGDVMLGDDDTPVIGLFETGGDDASVVLAQSIGGGGGLASFGCTNSGRPQGAAVASACFTNTGTASGTTPVDQMIAPAFVNTAQNYALGIQGSSSGIGGDVTMTLGDAGMHTTGDRATVIVAQALSGGGGYAAADRRNVASTGIETDASGGGAGFTNAVMGNIDISLSNTEITTAGNGSWGILAQAITGGGGLLGDTSADRVGVPEVAISSLSYDQALWSAGDINILLSDRSSILTGDSSHGVYPVNTHGIVAQSLGAGGGVEAGSNQDLQAPLQLTALADLPGSNGNITIVVDSGSSIDAQGIGAIGVLAQLGGIRDAGNLAQVNVSGSITGGRSGTNPLTGNTLDGVGIMMSGGGINDNLITVNEGGLVTTQNGTQSGYAIWSDYGSTSVTNNGTIVGSVILSDTLPAAPGRGGFVNLGTFAPGGIVRLPGSQLTNHGLIQVGDGDVLVNTQLTGDFEQSDSGRLVFAASNAGGDLAHSSLTVQGTANVAGTVAVLADALLPGTLPVLQADTLNLSASLEQPLLFHWQGEVTDQGLSLSPTATFRPLGVSLDATANSLAGYLQQRWQQADASQARLFGYLSQVKLPQQYRSTLQQLSGQSLLAQPQQMVQSSYDSFGDGLNCPAGLEAGVRQQGDNCTWARITGSRADQSGTSSTLGYRTEGGGLRVGFQHQLNEQWRIGATAGASQSRLTADDLSSKGQHFDLSMALTHQRGPLEITGGLLLARGNFRNDRTPQLGATGQALGLNTTYDSRSHTNLAGARLRTAYTHESTNHYVKPYLDVDVIHTRSPAFTESRSGPLALEVGAVSKTQAIISPMVEVGTERKLSSGSVVRGYVAAGASLMPGNERTTANRLTAADAGTFNLTREGPKAVGRFSLGMEVQAPKHKNVSFRAEYNAQAGDKFRSQSVSARLNIRF